MRSLVWTPWHKTKNFCMALLNLSADLAALNNSVKGAESRIKDKLNELALRIASLEAQLETAGELPPDAVLELANLTASVASIAAVVPASGDVANFA